MPRKNKSDPRKCRGKTTLRKKRRRVKPKSGDPVERFAWHIVKTQRLKKEVEPGARFRTIRQWLALECTHTIKAMLEKMTTTRICRLARGDNHSRKRTHLIVSACANVIDLIAKILSKHARRRLTGQH